MNREASQSNAIIKTARNTVIVYADGDINPNSATATNARELNMAIRQPARRRDSVFE